MKNYDVWFTLEHPASILVEANSIDEAFDVAEDILADMSTEELLHRITDALNYQGVKIEIVTEA